MKTFITTMLGFVFSAALWALFISGITGLFCTKYRERRNFFRLCAKVFSVVLMLWIFFGWGFLFNPPRRAGMVVGEAEPSPSVAPALPALAQDPATPSPAERTPHKRLTFSVARDGSEAVELSDDLEEELTTAFKRAEAARIPSGEGEVFRIVASGHGWFQFVLPFANKADLPTDSTPSDPTGDEWVVRFISPMVKAEDLKLPSEASFAEFAGSVETNQLAGTITLLVFRPASNPDIAYVFRANPRDANLANGAPEANDIASCVPGLGAMIGKVLGENAVPTATPSLAEETHAESAEDAEPEPHAEPAEGAEDESHAESAESKSHAPAADGAKEPAP